MTERRLEYSLQVQGGSMLFMPPWFQGEAGWGNLSPPNVYEADPQQRYPAGAKYVEGDRIFRYVKYLGQSNTSDGYIHTAIQSDVGENCMGRFMFNIGFPVTYAGSYVYGLVGTKIVEIDTTTLAIEQAADYYSGGWITGYSATNRFLTRRIVAHDYAASKVVGGTSKSAVSTLTVDQNLVSTLASMATSITSNPWKRTVWRWQDAGALYGHTVGAAMVNDMAVNSWYWSLTKGPMGCAHIESDFGGVSERETIYTLRGDGSINACLGSTSDTAGRPVIGHSLPSSIAETGSGQDDSYPMIWVDIGID